MFPGVWVGPRTDPIIRHSQTVPDIDRKTVTSPNTPSNRASPTTEAIQTSLKIVTRPAICSTMPLVTTEKSYR